MLLYKTQRNQVETDLKTSFLPARFHRAAGCLADCWGRKVNNGLTQQQTLHATILNCQVKCALWYMKVMRVISLFLIGFEACSIHSREFICSAVNLVKSSVTLEAIDPRREPVTVLLLNIVKLLYKYLCLCSQISAFLSLDLKEFSLLQAAVYTASSNGSKC